MYLSAPWDSSSAIGRTRPYKMGVSADAETTQRTYPSITLHHRNTEERSEVLLTVSSTCDPSAVLRRYKMRSLGIALTGLVVFWTMGVSDVAAERIRILDRCDPATFNAAGPVLCKPNFDGGVTLADFQELLTPSAFGHPAWRFNAPYLAIDP